MILRGTVCVTCERKSENLTIVLDQPIQAEGMCDCFKHSGKTAENVGKKILNNPGGALEIAACFVIAAASKNPKLIAAIAPDIISLFIRRKVRIRVKVTVCLLFFKC